MRKVLIAEDDITMVSLLKTLLIMEGYEVITADAESEITALVQQEHPDVLLLDVHLGKRSGLDILDALRGGGEAQKIRVIMSSGMNLKEDCLQHGADAFLLKPYMPDELIAMLKKVIPES